MHSKNTYVQYFQFLGQFCTCFCIMYTVHVLYSNLCILVHTSSFLIQRTSTSFSFLVIKRKEYIYCTKKIQASCIESLNGLSLLVLYLEIRIDDIEQAEEGKKWHADQRDQNFVETAKLRQKCQIAEEVLAAKHLAVRVANELRAGWNERIYVGLNLGV